MLWCLEMRPLFAVVLSVFMILFCGCIQPEKPPMVSEKEATEIWKADGIVGESEYSRSMHLQSPARQGYSGGDMELSWRNDADHLYLALNGSTDGWLAIGFEPLEWMKDADIIMASVDGDKAVVLDEYCTGNYGPHIEDTMLGGTNDIEEYGGRETGGRTVIEIKRRLNTGDKFDKSFSPGQSISMIWALSSSPDISQKHNAAFGEGMISLTGQQQVAKAMTAAFAPGLREQRGMLFIWEEEKTARDLYTSLYRVNNLSIFMDLARSESSHMDQVKAIMDQYDLAIPGNDEPGVFHNESLQKIYDDLLKSGSRSDRDALKAAAAFEEISIMDLERELNATDTENIRAVYQGLLAGSRKHLRSYVTDLHGLGIEYVPVHLDKGEFEAVVDS